MTQFNIFLFSLVSCYYINIIIFQFILSKDVFFAAVLKRPLYMRYSAYLRHYSLFDPIL